MRWWVHELLFSSRTERMVMDIKISFLFNVKLVLSEFVLVEVPDVGWTHLLEQLGANFLY